MEPTLVRDLLTDLRAAVVAVLTDPPARQLIGHGAFAHDCEMVGVRLATITFETADLGAGSPGCAVVPVIPLQLVVLRCWPTVDSGGIPDAAEITAASLTLADDAVAVTGALLDLWRAGTLFPTVGVHCSRVEFGPLEPIDPEGGIAGLTQTVSIRA